MSDIWYCVVCLIGAGKKVDRGESIYSKGCNMTQGSPDSTGHDDNDNATKQKHPGENFD